MTDVVYALWSKSHYNNSEIRYSVRSVWKHGKNLGRLFIVGMPVKFFQGHTTIPFSPAYRCKDVNIFATALEACKIPDISDPFLHFNDDYFMLQDFDASTLPAWYGEPRFQQERSQNVYDRTITILKLRGIARPKFFDVHAPILIYKDCIQKSCPKDWKKLKFLFKTMYANQCPVLTPLEISDCKVWTTTDLQRAKNRFMFSTTDYPPPEVWDFLKAKFPDPSPFEKGNP